MAGAGGGPNVLANTAPTAGRNEAIEFPCARGVLFPRSTSYDGNLTATAAKSKTLDGAG